MLKCAHLQVRGCASEREIQQRHHLLLQIPEGKWFLQNAANSEVGLLMIALCKSKGIKTINIVRREEAAQYVRDAG